MKTLGIVLAFFIIIITACVETTPVSVIPEVTFESLEVSPGYDSLGNSVKRVVLQFDFIDGDADIGISEGIASDTTLPDEERHNVFLIPFYKEDNEYLPIELDTTFPNNFYIIPYNEKLNRVGQNKTIKGTVKLNIDFLSDPEFDTLKYDFYIRDRSGNTSNVEETEDFSLKGIDFPPR